MPASPYGQTLDAELDQLRKAGCAKIYREKVTRVQPDRRELPKMLKALVPVDVVVAVITGVPVLFALSPPPETALARTNPARIVLVNHR